MQISAVTPEDAGTYTVVVSNVHGSVTSNPSTLTVLLRPPEITTQPGNQTLLSGAHATFTVAATGSLPMTFQWQRNGVDLNDGGKTSGAQTATLTIADAGIEDLGVYMVMISNAYGSVTSAAASLTVILQPPQISAGPTDQSVYSGSDVSFSVTAVGSLPLSYQWRCNGVALVDEGRISGSQTGTVTISGVEAQDLGLYVVEVRNAYGWTVSFPAQLTVVLAPPMITHEPQGQTVALGSRVSLQVEATGSLPLSYQWQREGADVVDGGRFSGARTSTMIITELSAADLGNYSVVVESALGRVQSTLATVATSSIMLQIRREGDQVVVSWNEAGRGMRLQKASQLADPDWQNVEGSETVISMTLPFPQGGMALFRLRGEPRPTFSIIEGSFTWHEAKADAEARGGHLATITSAEEWSECVQQVGDQIMLRYRGWIGATDEASEGDWRWVTGEPWEWSQWGIGEPSDGGGGWEGEDYAYVFDSGAGLYWNDVPAEAGADYYILEVSAWSP